MLLFCNIVIQQMMQNCNTNQRFGIVKERKMAECTLMRCCVNNVERFLL